MLLLLLYARALGARAGEVYHSCKLCVPTRRQLARSHSRHVEAGRAHATQEVPNRLIVDLEHCHADGDILGRAIRRLKKRLQHTCRTELAWTQEGGSGWAMANSLCT